MTEVPEVIHMPERDSGVATTDLLALEFIPMLILFKIQKTIIMSKAIIYHNPRCSKSRETLKLLEAGGTAYEIVEYLKTPPSKEELKKIAHKLGIKPLDFVRKGEKLYKEKFAGQDLADEEWFSILPQNPILIERPIVVKGDRAIIGRPPENVKKVI